MFDQPTADTICVELAKGRSLREICREIGISEATVRNWERDNTEFSTHSLRAREIGCLSMADEMLEIADDGTNDWMKSNRPDDEGYKVNGESIQRSRLRIDTRMRLLGKWLPKVFGDKLELAGDKDNPLTVVVRKLTDSKPD